jgi:hypothetical protein
MLSSTALLAFTAGILLPPASQEARADRNASTADYSLVVHDLVGLEFESEQPRPSVFLPSLRFRDEEEREFHEADRAIGPSHFVGLLENLLGDGLRGEGCRAEYTQDGRLLVVGPASLQEDVANLLAFFREVSTASVELTMDFVVLPGILDVPSMIDVGKLPALLESATSHSQHVLHVPTGRSATVSAGKRRYLVLDFDMEIAQGALIMDPVMGDFFEGVEATVRAAPCAGGLLVGLMARRGARVGDTPNKQLDIGAMLGNENGVHFENLPISVQAPSTANRSCGLSAVLPTGKALVVTTRGGESGGTELMILHQTGGALSAWSEYDLGDGARLVFADPACVMAPRLLASSTGLLSGGSSVTPVLDAEPRLIVGFESLGTGLVTDALALQGRTGHVDDAGPWLVTWPDAGQRRGGNTVGRSVAQQEIFDSLRVSVRQYEVELRLNTPQGEAGPVVRLPLRDGTSASVVLGLERLLVRDYDVEVAQLAAGSDPIVAASFEGLALWLQATGSPSGQLHLKVRGAVSYAGDGEAAAVQSPFVSYLDQSDERTLTLQESQALVSKDGRWETLLGDATGGVSIQVRVRTL